MVTALLVALLVLLGLIFVVLALGRKVFWIGILTIVGVVLLIAAIGAIGTPSKKDNANPITQSQQQR